MNIVNYGYECKTDIHEIKKPCESFDTVCAYVRLAFFDHVSFACSG